MNIITVVYNFTDDTVEADRGLQLGSYKGQEVVVGHVAEGQSYPLMWYYRLQCSRFLSLTVYY